MRLSLPSILIRWAFLVKTHRSMILKVNQIKIHIYIVLVWTVENVPKRKRWPKRSQARSLNASRSMRFRWRTKTQTFENVLLLRRPNFRKKLNRFLVFTSFIKREIRKFHVVVVQQRQRTVQKSVMHVKKCCFVNLNLLLFCSSRCRRRC